MKEKIIENPSPISLCGTYLKLVASSFGGQFTLKAIDRDGKCVESCNLLTISEGRCGRPNGVNNKLGLPLESGTGKLKITSITREQDE